MRYIKVRCANSGCNFLLVIFRITYPWSNDLRWEAIFGRKWSPAISDCLHRGRAGDLFLLFAGLKRSQKFNPLYNNCMQVNRLV